MKGAFAASSTVSSSLSIKDTKSNLSYNVTVQRCTPLCEQVGANILLAAARICALWGCCGIPTFKVALFSICSSISLGVSSPDFEKFAKAKSGLLKLAAKLS